MYAKYSDPLLKQGLVTVPKKGKRVGGGEDWTEARKCARQAHNCIICASLLFQGVYRSHCTA